jgi:hypothetical protein
VENVLAYYYAKLLTPKNLTSQGLHSQHFNFFITYERAQLVKVFVPGKPFQLIVKQHHNLFGSFERCEENEVLRMGFLGIG